MTRSSGDPVVPWSHNSSQEGEPSSGGEEKKKPNAILQTMHFKTQSQPSNHSILRSASKCLFFCKIQLQERKIMPFDLESAFRTILECQEIIFESTERMISRSSKICERAYEPIPTRYHEANETSTSNWYQPSGYFSHEDHHDYGERYQSWNTEYGNGESCPCPFCDEEKTRNMLWLILVKTRRMTLEMEARAHRTTNSLMRLEPEETSIPHYKKNSYEAHITYMECDFEEDAHLEDDFQHEVEEHVYQFESLSECIVDENLILRSKEQGETVTFMIYYTNLYEEEVSFVENVFKDLDDDILVFESAEETKESLVFYKRALA